MRVQETLTEMLRESSVWAGLDNNKESTHLIVDSPCGNASMRRYHEWSHASAHTWAGL